MSNKLVFEPRWYAVFIFFIAGLFLGGMALFVWIFNGGSFYGIQKIHSKGNYKFINPLIAVERTQAPEFFENQALKDKLNTVLQKHKKNQDIQDASIYFRDLEPGRWMGINEDFKFSPGKFLKLPIMIAYFKEAEVNPAILKKTLVYHATPENTFVDNQVNLEDGQSYPAEELIRDMIIDDDDDAATVLYDNIDTQALNEVFSDLGIDFKEDKTNDDYLSTKLYSLFFRVLYNATYLNREFSEMALDILSQTNPTGIAAGLPNDILIAHKYRTRSFVQNKNTLVESHDCGIIYYPGHPYLLCAMAIGKNRSLMSSMFKELGQTAYKDMSEKYKN